MTRASSAAFLLLIPLTLSAQSAPQSLTSTWVIPLKSVATTCPVGMHARQGEWDHTIRVRNGEKQPQPPGSQFGQRIVLTLVDAHTAAIVSATLVVNGFDGKNHMLQTNSSSGIATRTLRAVFTRETKDSFFANIDVPGFTAVTSLRLLDVTYADGSTWNSTSANLCHAVPDPLMLVAAH
jgi:hypothetical protein